MDVGPIALCTNDFVHIEMQIALTMAGVHAVIEQARLTEIRSGDCTVSGTLAIMGIEVAKRQSKFALPGAVRRRNGVKLLELAPNTRSAAQAFASDAEAPHTPGAWYSDPAGRYELRWWNRSCWTQCVSTKGRTMSDPIVCETVSPPERALT